MSWVKKLSQMGADQLSEFKVRFDSWTNAMTGLMTSRDKTSFTMPFLDPVLAPQNLEALYHGDDIAARMVAALPDEVFREGVMVVNKSAANAINEYMDKNRGAPNMLQAVQRMAREAMPDNTQERANELQRDLDNFGATAKHHEAMTWGRLYGTGAIFMGIDDGRPAWEPIDYENIRGVDFMTVLDKRDIVPWRWYANMEAPKFGDVAVYLVQPVGVYVGAPYDIVHTEQVLLVHESRMIRYGGELTSKRLRLANNGSDYSVLQKAFRALQLVNDNWQSAASLLSDASQGVFSVRGLIDMIAKNPEIMTQRFAFMDLVRSTFRAIVLDAGDQNGPAETFTRVATPFTGIPEMLEHSWTRAASAARMPKVILMGSSTKGLGDTGDSELRWWYDTVRATQKKNVTPQFERQLRLFAMARGWDDVDDWTVVFPPLWQLTAKEEAEMHAQQANADKVYAEAGWVTPEEGALSRFGGGKYSLETKIDVESRKRSMQLRIASMEQEAANELETSQDPAPTPGVTAAEHKAAETASDDPLPPRTVDS
jgi:phage-related protein (TIGR01555 family)